MPAIVVPLEDELGDVLEKAMRAACLSVEALAAASSVAAEDIHDALDYRSELTCVELGRIARVIGLNEVGLCALAEGRYPLPELPALPFSLQPLRMRHGVGVANAYLISEPGAVNGILFDTGPSLHALRANWPPSIRKVDAVFLSHVETEHMGGLCDVVEHFGISAAYVPERCETPCGMAMKELEPLRCGGFEITAYSTPGHASAHYCYRVRATGCAESAPGVLVSGDLIFAGSAGGAYFCCDQHRQHLRRILKICPENTIIAPGHGPLTTIAHELRFNPFAP